MNSQNEIILYHINETQELEVRVAEETVWLTQAQIAMLFDTSAQNITMHIRNVYKEKELEQPPTCKYFLQVRQEGARIVNRKQLFYNLDLIISVGYRVRSIRATQFRIWATSVLKNFLLSGGVTNQRLNNIEKKLYEHDNQIQKLIQTTLPPTQGIFFNGQIFDAYQFVANLIRSAKSSIFLIDNYINDSVLTLLTKRNTNVAATIVVNKISAGLQLDIDRHNAQYSPISIREIPIFHDRFILIDNTRLYTFGASFKDLGKKLFCFSLIESEEIVRAIQEIIST